MSKILDHIVLQHAILHGINANESLSMVLQLSVSSPKIYTASASYL